MVDVLGVNVDVVDVALDIVVPPVVLAVVVVKVLYFSVSHRFLAEFVVDVARKAPFRDLKRINFKSYQ